MSQEQGVFIDLDSEPPGGQKERRYDLTRAPAKGKIEGYILSPRPLACRTHYHRGRTRPHHKTNCPGCADKCAFKWHAHFFVWNKFEDTIKIFQVTPGPWPEIREYMRKHNTLRGACISIRRRKPHANAEVLAKLVPSNLNGLQLPEPPDLQACMMRIWFGGFKNKDFVPTTVDGEPQTVSFLDEPPSGCDVLDGPDDILTNDLCVTTTPGKTQPMTAAQADDLLRFARNGFKHTKG